MSPRTGVRYWGKRLGDPPAPTRARPGRRHRSARGALTLDVIGALGLSAWLLLMCSYALTHLSAVQETADARRLVLQTAREELHRIRVGLQAPPRAGERAVREVGRVRLETSVEEGDGPWAGFLKVQVTAGRLVRGHEVRISLAEYVRPPGGQP